jgi:hypothetical protein
MFKKLSIQELLKIKTNFFKNLKNLYTKKKYNTITDFINHYMKDLNEVYFLEWGDFTFKIEKTDNKITFIDNKEKIILETSKNELKTLHNILKWNNKTIAISKNKTILQELFEKFKNWENNSINWKPYLVYDIETIWTTVDLKKTKFALAYSIISSDDHSKNLKFKYISSKNLKKFVDFLIDFDGYIVWYNNIYFDNPVIIYNTFENKPELIDKLNNKSIDIFLFIWNLTGRRLWLDNVSKSLIGIKKTLSSWKEWEEYLRQYEKTGDIKLLEKVKNYCKNDVRMTLGILLYLIANKKFFLDWKEYEYDLETFIKYASTKREEKNKDGKENMNKLF